MLDIQGTAIKRNGWIDITVVGNLPDFCTQAHLVEVRQERDGDEIRLQVEIEQHENSACVRALNPWAGFLHVEDQGQRSVHVFIKGDRWLEIAVLSEDDALKSPRQFQVIGLVDGEAPQAHQCTVLPADAVYPPVYRQMFGPSSMGECNTWIRKNCTPHTSV